MKQIQESKNKHHWPRKKYHSVKCRKKDLVLRITDWSKDKNEPGFDVEIYIGGIYDWTESKVCAVSEYKTLSEAKNAAISFAKQQIQKLL